MDNLNFLLKALHEKNYIGKQEVISVLSSEDVEMGLNETKINSELIENETRFLEITKSDTMYKIYILKTVGELEDQWKNHEDDICRIIGLNVNPFYKIRIYLDKNENILGAIKGYDIKKTPDDLWEELWGRR